MQVALMGAVWLAPQLSYKSKGLQFEFISAGICMYPQCRSHWGLTPVLPGLTEHLRIVGRSTRQRAFGPRVCFSGFFSPELSCRNWLFCDLPANLASPLSGALVLHRLET
ncbi:unnamed protein product [Pipistrellus nathusii]|uniref:Secreted protein n=1 Tax=Pipistrellus nathusii TaxID=59473 RepID=A0ABP0AFD2_PIPNA